MIPYGRQEITQDDIDEVTKVLHSDFLTQGPKIPDFEVNVARHVGANHAVAVNSATSALHLACLSLGLGPGDYLWTSPISFVASANCALYCGAKVDFVDIDPQTFNMSAFSLEHKLIQAQRYGKLPKIVIPVHMCGQSCDMKDIYQLSLSYGFKVIEDASHAIGAKYQNEFVGNCRYSDITIFSFHPVKIITTAEGGMAVTNNSELAQKMRLLRSHGITRDQLEMTHESDGPWYYQQIELGFNYRMTELQAALGSSQIKRLNLYIERRHLLSNRYNKLLANYPLITPVQKDECYTSYHLYVIRLRCNLINYSHRQVFENLRRDGIGVNLHYIPIHLQPYYTKLGFKEGDFPESERFYKESISLPLYPTMTIDQQDLVIKSLEKSL